ncbi:MAG TPA: class I SAM-dependent methyltransferase [Candidatus Dormibacteraeota bacterium]
MDLRPRSTRAEEYDAGFEARARGGMDVHGEARFVASLGVRSVLDAGCGTGRMAIELARRGLDVVGVDVDPSMLDVARRKAPHLEWALQDLATLHLLDDQGRNRRFDAAVLAGNVMLFVRRGTEAAIVAALAAHLRPGGLLVAGFQLDAGPLTWAAYDTLCVRAGLRLHERWSTWDRDAWTAASGYVVSNHRLDEAPAGPDP